MDEQTHPPLDDATGGMRLELRTFDTEGNPVPLTDGPATIGQPVQVYAINPSGPILAVAFNFDMTAVVETFLASEDAGNPVPYDAAGLVVNPLTFCPIKAGPLLVTCTVTTPQGPQYVSITVQISAPTVTALSAITGNPEVWTTGGKTLLQLTNQPNGPGITITATVNGTQALPGTLAFIQIARNARWLTGSDHRTHPWSLNGQPVVDVGGGGSYIYQNTTEPLAPQQQAQTIWITDSPGQELGNPNEFDMCSIGEQNAPETYQSFLMFCANAMGSIWVPLAVLNWNWGGFSEVTNGAWGPVEDPQCQPNPGGMATRQFPTWQGNTSQGTWLPSTDTPAQQPEAQPPHPAIAVPEATYGVSMPIMLPGAAWWAVGPQDDQGLPLLSCGFGQAPFKFYSIDPNDPTLVKVQAPNGNYLNIRGGFGIGALYCDCTSFANADQFKLVMWKGQDDTDTSSPDAYYFLISPDGTYAATINDQTNAIVFFLDDAQQPAEYPAMFLQLTSM